MPPIAEPPLKVCYVCGQAMPIEQFRPRKRGSTAREGSCRDCYNAYMRGYRQARRSKTLRRFTAQLRRENSLQRALGLVAGMTLRFGGVEGLCREWMRHLNAAEPGSRTALNTFLAIARMAELLEPSRPPEGISQLTDEELQQELKRSLGLFQQ